MAPRTSFARAHAWWSWDHPKIVRAIAWATQEHLLPLMKDVLRENARAGRQPDSMDAVRQFIRRDPRNVERTLGGKYAPSDGFRLALATALRIPVGDLFPSNSQWIGRATWRLCEGAVAAEDAIRYGVFREQRSDNDDVGLDRIIAVLDPLLAAINKELSAKGK